MSFSGLVFLEVLQNFGLRLILHGSLLAFHLPSSLPPFVLPSFLPFYISTLFFPFKTDCITCLYSGLQVYGNSRAIIDLYTQTSRLFGSGPDYMLSQALVVAASVSRVRRLNLRPWFHYSVAVKISGSSFLFPDLQFRF